jgi:dATP pyrophosphohydrolase
MSKEVRRMARQPRQVHVYLYRKSADGEYEYAIFQRSENALWWQGVCGGVEAGETDGEAARRELWEEAGIRAGLPLHRLTTMSYLPAGIFSAETQALWGRDVVVIPMTFFAMPYDGDVALSEEHTGFQWLAYPEAEKLVYFHDQKVALWELNERLFRGNLEGG